QTRSGGYRRRDESRRVAVRRSHRARRRQIAPPGEERQRASRRRRFRHGARDRELDHAGAGRGRPDDDRYADEKHSDRGRVAERRMILKAGLTGGIASGKSTIARMFGDLGCIVLDADALVAELYRPGNAGHRALVATYGGEILRPDGEVDRQKLANVAFTDAAAAQKLNALIHPLVMEEEARIAAEEERRRGGEDAIYVVEATLLLEAGGKQRYDRIIVVDVDPVTQVERGVAR